MKHAVVLIMVLVVASAAPIFAQQENGGGICRIDGSWMGSAPAWGIVWTGVFDSDSYWTGPVIIRYMGGDPSFGGLIPTVESFSLTVGTWRRTGIRTFRYTHVTYGLDEAGQPVYVSKLTGSSVASPDCTTVESSGGEISIYDPSQDIFSDEIPLYGTIQDPSVNSSWRIHAGRRSGAADWEGDGDS